MVCRSCGGSGNLLTLFWSKIDFISCFSCGGAGVFGLNGTVFGPPTIKIHADKIKKPKNK